MDTEIEPSYEELTEILKWVDADTKEVMKEFFSNFYDIYDKYLEEVVKCKKIDEYIELERKFIAPTVSKPGKIPIRLNKPETKVPAVYYFLSLFLIKWAGEHTSCFIKHVLAREKHAAYRYERMKTHNVEILENSEDLKKIMADSSLTNGLVIQDLENRIRNLEADR
ncbi:unnamed protein product [Rhizophagus irregularis]|nr:unnamed protein product [Rhizophagus irregularis]